MSVHSELFVAYGAPLIMGYHGDPSAVRLVTKDGEEIACSIASLGPIDIVNETVTSNAGNVTERVARRIITLDIEPPIDAIAHIGEDAWSIEEISASATLTRVNLIRFMGYSYANKQIE